MNQSFVVRRAVSSDEPSLIEGNRAMARETEGLVLDRERLARGVAALLADPAKGSYIVAQAESSVIGQLMVTLEWSDWRCGWFWWIQSVHVDSAWRRKGVYRALHQECERLAREAGACGLRLYVDRSNTGAQASYLALGMNRSHYDLFETTF